MAEVTPLIRDELLPPRGPARRHLISIADLTKEDVERLLALARTFSASLEREVKKLPALKGRTVVNMFFESSTRTSSSFELAAKRLSADVMSIKATGSSVQINLPRSAQLPETTVEWKVPQWSNTIERDRARVYFVAYAAGMALYFVERALAEVRSGLDRAPGEG